MTLLPEKWGIPYKEWISFNHKERYLATQSEWDFDPQKCTRHQTDWAQTGGWKNKHTLVTCKLCGKVWKNKTEYINDERNKGPKMDDDQYLFVYLDFDDYNYPVERFRKCDSLEELYEEIIYYITRGENKQYETYKLNEEISKNITQNKDFLLKLTKEQDRQKEQKLLLEKQSQEYEYKQYLKLKNKFEQK